MLRTRCLIGLLGIAIGLPSPGAWDFAQAADKFPTPTTVLIESRADAINRYFREPIVSPIEGIWLEDNNESEIAVIPAPSEFKDHCDYVGVITDSEKRNWKPGEVKLLLTEAASKGLYSVIYRTTGLKTTEKAWATLSQQGTLVLQLKRRRAYFKIHPKWPTAAEQGAVDGTTQALGSGFMLTPTTAVSSHHVVRGATTVTVIVGPMRVPARTLLQDERNDLVILQLQPQDSVVARMLKENTTCLSVRDDVPAAGERVFSLGYPLANFLNEGIVITEGLISSAVGPSGDSGLIQTSAAIQPGGSGGPLLDHYGRVVGVVAATANAATFYRETGALPQNVNFAISAAPLRAMTRFLPEPKCANPATNEKAMNGQELKTLCGRAVVRIEAGR